MFLREEGKKQLLNETFLFKSQMRGNYSSSDYEAVVVKEIRVQRLEAGEEGGLSAICSQWTADEEEAG